MSVENPIKQNQPDPEAQYLRDLANAKDAIDEASRPVYEELGEKATAFLRDQTIQPTSGDEIAQEATRYLRLHDRITGNFYRDRAAIRNESFIDLARNQEYAVDEIHNQMEAAKSKPSIKNIPREHKPDDNK